MKLLAVIPAREGSKGIRNKNIVLLCGKPLIYYTIKCALDSKVFEKVIVSTDSEKIAEISKKYGAEVPFLRPKELATDQAKGIDVLIHAMEWIERNFKKFDAVMYLQPTSPLRTVEDIKLSLEIFQRKNANSVVSVTEVDHHPYWSNTIPPDGKMDNFIRPEYRNRNRQELPKFYRLNGAIFLAKWDYIKKTKDWFAENSYAYIMPRERSIDIDSEVDLVLAEYFLKKRGDCFEG